MIPKQPRKSSPLYPVLGFESLAACHSGTITAPCWHSFRSLLVLFQLPGRPSPANATISTGPDLPRSLRTSPPGTFLLFWLGTCVFLSFLTLLYLLMVGHTSPRRKMRPLKPEHHFLSQCPYLYLVPGSRWVMSTNQPLPRDGILIGSGRARNPSACCPVEEPPYSGKAAQEGRRRFWWLSVRQGTGHLPI